MCQNTKSYGEKIGPSREKTPIPVALSICRVDLKESCWLLASASE